MKIVQGNIVVELTPYQEEIKEPSKSKSTKKATSKLSVKDTEFFEILRKTRQEIAKQDEVPAFVIFGNASLLDMVNKKPKTKQEFSQISGVGATKLEKYWPLFKDVLVKGV